MRIGAHQSIAGGLQMAPVHALETGLECFQMFTKSPRSWSEPQLSPGEIACFARACRQNGFGTGDVAVHASYLVNPCAESVLTREKAVQALCEEARRCEALQVPYLVFHPGSPGRLGEEAGIALVAEALLCALEVAPAVHFLIENTAGSGKSIGNRFEHLAHIIRLTADHARVGCCFDTAHGFAAGYPLSDAQGAAEVFASFGDIVGMHRLKWIHLNDSRTGCGSRVDRHERIGQGRIGAGLFQWMVRQSVFENIPATLETPLESGETYQQDAAQLRRWRDGAIVLAGESAKR